MSSEIVKELDLICSEVSKWYKYNKNSHLGPSWRILSQSEPYGDCEDHALTIAFIANGRSLKKMWNTYGKTWVMPRMKIKDKISSKYSGYHTMYATPDLKFCVENNNKVYTLKYNNTYSAGYNYNYLFTYSKFYVLYRVARTAFIDFLLRRKVKDF